MSPTPGWSRLIKEQTSGRQDSNLRPLDPQSSALAKLRHAPKPPCCQQALALLGSGAHTISKERRFHNSRSSRLVKLLNLTRFLSLPAILTVHYDGSQAIPQRT